MPAYFERYTSLIPDIELNVALEKYGANLLYDHMDDLYKKRDFAYAVGKWTVKQMLQHINDTERVFAYRALTLGRHDNTALPGFDENIFADRAPASYRSIDDLLHELDLLRKCNLILFSTFSDDDLCFVGNTNGKENTALAIGFTMCGHILHHLNVLRERYF
jgi:hypothetical protein